MTLGEIIYIREPQLQFSVGKHNLAIDPRFGLHTFHPLDYNTGKREFSNINIGVIAKEDEIKPVLNLLSNLNNKFYPKGVGSKIPYDGFKNIYKIPVNIPKITDDKVISISNSEINDIIGKEDAFKNIITLYNSKIQQYIDNNTGRDILILQMPKVFERYFKFNYEDLRDHIKALCVKKHVYTQILTEGSLKPHDMCDNMWNLSLGLYVKSGGIPWKLESGGENTCFIGITFGVKKKKGGREILIGLAEVFDVFGESITIKVVEDSFNSEVGYHLSKEKAKRLLKIAIDGYTSEKGEKPRRIIVHKTTFFNEDEKMGMESALADITYDLVHLQLNTALRLMPDGMYPPNRGTFWKINGERGLFYSTGYVEEFGTYPGAATPSPIEINKNYGDTMIKKLTEQIYGLTKMDWNTTVLMNKEPITIKYARRVNDILKTGLEAEGILKDFRYYF